MKLAVALVALSGLSAFSHADTLPFGAASAYNLVALGSTNGSGSVVLAGNISTSADITGRVAAANMVTAGTTIGSSLNSDPYGYAATFDLISNNGLNAGSTFNINSHGNVYAPGTNGSFNFNGGGHRVTSGGSGLDFEALRTTLTAETASLASLVPNGVNLGTNAPGVINPSFYVLKGTSNTLNVFNITAVQLADTNHPIDIEAPAGSTIIVNVSGTDATVGTGIYYNGHQNSGDSNANSNILFNFPDALTVTVHGQFNASMLAPYAFLSGNAQMGGTFIAAQIGQTGEVHNVEFTGNLTSIASTPEPGTFALLGTGALSIAGMVRRRKSAKE
ncbi:MAG: choice-of-anchor A family protein [Acidobacteria bacterium]|nr:choice-of-anchor A family protein [Acidobacteriota bacterium]